MHDPIDGPTDDPRELLARRCRELGLSDEEIREAGDDLLDVAIQHLFVPVGGRMTLAEVVDAAGVPAARVLPIIRATGLTEAETEEPLFGPSDIHAMSMLTAAQDLLGTDAVLQMVRVAANAVARIGDAAISTFVTSTGAPALQSDESGLALLEANVAGAELVPLFGDWLQAMLVRHLRRSYRPMPDDYLETTAATGIDTMQLAIGFADLVDSTVLADRSTLPTLNAALDAFERAAADTITAAGGRLVKFIGDEVMYRADTADDACRIAVDLVDLVRDDPRLPPLRVGVALGEVLTRDGDFHGPVVNLAARATKLAPPDGVVITGTTATALGTSPGLRLEALGSIEMRGFSAPVELVAVSR